MRYSPIPWLALALALAASTPARAFTTLAGETAGDATWAANTVPVFLDVLVSPDVSLPEVEAALAGSLAAWNAADCTALRLEYAGLVSGSPRFGVYIHWADPSMVGDVVGVDAAAVTETWLTPTGEIFRADMHLNPMFAWATAAEAAFPENNDVEGVITHELGHAIGLSHSRERSATMYFAGGDASLRVLDDDDLRAVCFQYPTVPFTAGHACDTCSAHANCGSGRCLSFPEGGDYCATPCAADADCPGGFSCAAVPTAKAKLCLPNNLYCHEGGGTIPLGGYCYGHATCASGTCLPTRTSAQCTDSCDPATDSCPGGMSCVMMSGQCDGPCALCLKTGTGAIGEPCLDATTCSEAVCVGEGDVGRCSAFCDAAGDPCPDGATCAGGLCTQPGERPTGAPCDTGFDCAGALCLSLGLIGAECSARCGDAAPCAGNATCERFDLARECSSAADCGGPPCETIKPGIKLCGCASAEDCGAGETCGLSGLGGPKVCQLRLCQVSSASSKEGELCDAEHPCVAGLSCDLSGGHWGLCRAACTPGADPCPAESGCAWSAGASSPAGLCQPLDGATATGACSDVVPCQAGLACVSVAGAAGACAADCVPPDGPCASGVCTDLGATGWPGRGACVAGAAVLIPPAAPTEPQPPEADAGPGGGATIDGDRYVAIDRVGTDDGCSAGGSSGRLGSRAAGMLAPWALIGLLALRARKRRRNGGLC